MSWQSLRLLWKHTSLPSKTVNNIGVSVDAMHIEDLMDWQRTAILALFLHVSTSSAIQLERDQLPQTRVVPEPTISLERLSGDEHGRICLRRVTSRLRSPFALVDDEREAAAELYQKLGNAGEREKTLASLVVYRQRDASVRRRGHMVKLTLQHD